MRCVVFAALIVAACGSPNPGAGPDASGAGGGDGAPSGDAGSSADRDAAPYAPVLNPFGIGLVSPGNATQLDRARELTGRGGHIKLVFAGVDTATTTAPADWIAAVNAAYDRELIPVIRLGPPWGNRDVRDDSDDSAHHAYTQLAAHYAAVVAALPRRDGWPLVIELHNEPDLCYEWACRPEDAPAHDGVPAGWMHYSDIAAEYAAFMRDVTTAIHAIGDPRILVINGGLAPGGAVTCQCGGDGFTAGITSRDFLTAMIDAVPGVFDPLDGFASHSYPAQGEGWGFFSAYADSGPGLHYYQTELAILGIDKPVYMTETGWTIADGAHGSREDVAAWTLSAWQNDWWQQPQIRAVMPFMLQDPDWDAFGWIDAAGNPYPVFTSVRAWRCSMAFPDPC